MKGHDCTVLPCWDTPSTILPTRYSPDHAGFGKDEVPERREFVYVHGKLIRERRIVEAPGGSVAGLIERLIAATDGLDEPTLYRDLDHIGAAGLWIIGTRSGTPDDEQWLAKQVADEEATERRRYDELRKRFEEPE